MATTKSKTKAKGRGSGKRDLVENRAGAFYAHRGPGGQFKDMEERGRSLAADRRQKAKTVVKSGYGDRGDQRR
jgi:hypothetical protein